MTPMKPLAAPVIVGAFEGVVVVNGESPRPVVRIEPYVGMDGGDRVQLRWDTGVLRTARIDMYVIDVAGVGKRSLFVVPHPRPGTARVSYLVGRATGEWQASE
ncbi:hypothetical protein [Streptomyces violascens]|uniref:hypothetical protein n=1 Tax=Streptomyces violascens TaxID=67381 RepID=UPI0036574291